MSEFKVAHEKVKKMCDMLNHVWEVIGGDVLEARKFCNESTVLTREEVMEIVLDADHIKTYGDKEAVILFDYLNKFERQEVLRLAFPYKTYSY